MNTAKKLPTSIEDLASLIAKTPAEDRDKIRRNLIGQLQDMQLGNLLYGEAHALAEITGLID